MMVTLRPCAATLRCDEPFECSRGTLVLRDRRLPRLRGPLSNLVAAPWCRAREQAPATTRAPFECSRGTLVPRDRRLPRLRGPLSNVVAAPWCRAGASSRDYIGTEVP